MVLTSMALLFGLLAASASRPSDVNATFGLYVYKFKVSTIAAQKAGVSFNVTVEAQDYWGYRVRSYDGANAKLSGLAASPNGTAPSGMGVAGSWSNGIGTFPVTAVLAASSNAITVTDAVKGIAKTSNTFAVAHGNAARLVTTANPASTYTADANDISASFQVQDAYGNVATSSTASVSLALTGGTSGAILGGTNPKAASAGNVTFNDLTVRKVGSGYGLTASSGSLATANTTTFSITHGAATRLATTANPAASYTADANDISASFQVQDAWGNAVTTGAAASAGVAVTLSGGSAGAALGGTTSKAAVAGAVSFSDLNVRKAGTGYKLTAGSTGLTGADTTTFDVNPGPLELSFAGQPVDAEVSAPIKSSFAGDPVKVLLSDAFANVAVGANVVISAATFPADVATSLGGTTTAATGADGIASFGNLTIGQTGSFMLKANASGASQVESDAFEVVADLAACDGGVCTSSATTSGNNKQTTYSTINTGGDFDNEVILTTSFLSPADGSQCTDDTGVFGQTTEVRVQGSGVSETQPSFKVAVIYPKTTLQALGLSSRNADSFNVCLGATRLAGSGAFRAKTTAENPALTDADPDLVEANTYWGWLADCSAVAAGNPCVSLKTKNADQLKAELGGVLPPEFKSSDLAVVVYKPWPWDGKITMK